MATREKKQRTRAVQKWILHVFPRKGLQLNGIKNIFGMSTNHRIASFYCIHSYFDAGMETKAPKMAVFLSFRRTLPVIQYKLMDLSGKVNIFRKLRLYVDMIS